MGRDSFESAMFSLVAALPLLVSCGSDPASPPASTCADTGTCPQIRVTHRTRSGGATEVLEGSVVSLPSTQVSGRRYFDFLVDNPGASTLTLTGTPAIQVSGPDADQFWVWGPGWTTLGPRGETYFFLHFEPTTVGTKRATISVPSDAASGTLTFDVEGEARDSIWLFSSRTTHTGDLGGRAGADALCAVDGAGIDPTGGCTTVKAFIGVGAGDLISNLPAPANHDVRTVRDVLIDTSWANLWDGDAILANLSSILGTEQWWSGSNGDGTVAQTCGGWTNGGTTDSGTLGSGTSMTSDAIGAGWVGSGALGCDIPQRVLCVCW